MKLTDLPSAIRPPDEYKAGREWRRSKRQTTRREFIRMITTASLGTGLAFASLMPTARPARATHNTKTSTYQESVYCSDNGSFVDDTGCCDCGSDVSSKYCDSDDWHRHHSVVGLSLIHI